MLGFWLNGRFTFSGDEHHMGRKPLARFVLMWLTTTVVSTWAMGSIDDWFGLQWAWIAKPAVELALGAIGSLLPPARSSFARVLEVVQLMTLILGCFFLIQHAFFVLEAA